MIFQFLASAEAEWNNILKVEYIQTWKKLIFVRNLIFGVKKCPQIHIVPEHLNVPKIAIIFHYCQAPVLVNSAT